MDPGFTRTACSAFGPALQFVRCAHNRWGDEGLVQSFPTLAQQRTVAFGLSSATDAAVRALGLGPATLLGTSRLEAARRCFPATRSDVVRRGRKSAAGDRTGRAGAPPGQVGRRPGCRRDG